MLRESRRPGAHAGSGGGERPRLVVGLLGPLAVTVDGQPVVVTTGRLRAILATLAMAAGNSVSVDGLAEALWGDTPPDNVRRSVQTYVTRLRGVVGAGAIGTTPAGYVLRADPDDVDALRFARLLDAAAAAEPAAEPDLLAQALALWRGEPFADVRSLWLMESQGLRLVERYLWAVERRVDLELAAGRPGGLAAELRRLTAEHPLRESLWARLLVVLDRAGQRAEALRQYEAVRVRLADQLGVAPGAELQRLYAGLLVDRPLPAADRGPAESWSARRGLPPEIAGLTGRAAELAALDELVAADGNRRLAAVAVVAGTAGVGKTTLVLHWAHRVADRFPDGQLYVDLRGFDSGDLPVPPAEAVRALLDALGVPAHRIPIELDAQVGLYRTVVADRRVLVVLDNARDVDQVRPLLPGAAGCLTVVTSRNQLTGLVVAGARPVGLDLLPAADALLLLADRLGADRVAAEPAAVAEIVARCARLPLALAVVAARAATNPRFPLDAYAGELRDAQRGLDALTLGDVETDVRAVFSWSYRTLSPPAARLFRLLGLHPGPDVGAAAAASLAGVDRRRSHGPLAELCRAHLLTEYLPGRYTCHDLLRAYAIELAHGEETAGDREQATLRVLDHYLHTAKAAQRFLSPPARERKLPPAQPGVTLERMADQETALAWFDVEHPTLVAAVRQAAGTFETHAWRLARTTTTYFYWRGQWHDSLAVQHIAVGAASRVGDRLGEAGAHGDIGQVFSRLGRPDEAVAHLRSALALYGEAGDDDGRAGAHLNLSLALEVTSEYQEALRHCEQALALYQATGSKVGQARALNNVGWFHGLLGDHDRTLGCCRQALALFQELGDQAGQGVAWDSVGHAHHHLGQFRQAVAAYRRAVDRYRALGHRYNESETLSRLGDTHAAAGDPAAARAAWRAALGILTDLGHPQADEVRAKLSDDLAPCTG